MADIRLMEFVEATSANDNDLLYLMSDPATSGDKRRIKVGTIRESLAPNIVRPSGDSTGATDSAAIASAISEATQAPSSRGHGTVFLDGRLGDFYVNEPIVVGIPSELNAIGGQKSVNLRALTHARIEYVGPQTTDYMLYVFGSTYSPTPRVSGLYLDCNSNCRGINMYQTYMAGLENTMVFTARQVGVDWNSSWKSYCRNLHIWYTNGIAFRTNYANGCVFDNMRIGQGTATQYPATDDTTIENYAGNAVVTAEANRGAVVIDVSKECVFRSLMFEGNSVGAWPLISIVARNCYGVHFTESLYTEANTCTGCWVYLDGSSLNTSGFGHDFLFENVGLHQAGGNIPFIKTDGYIDYVRVNGIRDSSGGAALSAVITSDGSGSHLYRATVAGARCGVASASQVVATNSGSVEATSPYSFNYTSVE